MARRLETRSLKPRPRGDWTAVEHFSDVLSARAYAERLLAEGVPAKVRTDTPLLGELRPAEVVVPTALVHRARWRVAQWAVSESELARQALGLSDEDGVDVVPG